MCSIQRMRMCGWNCHSPNYGWNIITTFGITWLRMSEVLLFNDMFVWVERLGKNKPWNTIGNIIYHPPSLFSVRRVFFFLLIYCIEEKNPNIKWYKMIYERGSLESRAMKMPSAWKSNKRPLWISEWGVGMYRKPFTGWSCIKQTSPPQIFMGRDLLINLSLSSISLFCIHQEFGTSIGYNHLHFKFCCWGWLVDSCLLYCLHAADNKSTLILECIILSSLCLHWKLDLKFSQATSQTVRPRGFQAHGFKWGRSSGDHTSGGSLRLNRITTTARMLVSIQTHFTCQCCCRCTDKNEQTSTDWRSTISSMFHISIKRKSTEYGNRSVNELILTH